MYKLVLFAPADDKEKVKNALFDAGAGTQGNYSRCCWECEGTGQFLPGEGSNPAVGRVSELERVKEFRVEMLVSDELVPICTETLKLHHPYEEPAFEFIKVITLDEDLSGEEWL